MPRPHRFAHPADAGPLGEPLGGKLRGCRLHSRVVAAGQVDDVGAVQPLPQALDDRPADALVSARDDADSRFVYHGSEPRFEVARNNPYLRQARYYRRLLHPPALIVSGLSQIRVVTGYFE